MVQSPYARLIVGVPKLAISAITSDVTLAVALSASISTAKRFVSVRHAREGATSAAYG